MNRLCFITATKPRALVYFPVFSRLGDTVGSFVSCQQINKKTEAFLQISSFSQVPIVFLELFFFNQQWLSHLHNRTPCLCSGRPRITQGAVWRNCGDTAYTPPLPPPPPPPPPRQSVLDVVTFGTWLTVGARAQSALQFCNDVDSITFLQAEHIRVYVIQFLSVWPWICLSCFYPIYVLYFFCCTLRTQLLSHWLYKYKYDEE